MAARKSTPIHVACTAVLLEPVSCPLLLAPRRAEAMAAMDVTQTQRCITAPDPLADWFETFLTLSEQDDLLQHLHCQDLFQGMGAGDGCYATVRQWLQEIWEDEREHREVAADSRFTTRTLLPKPFEISLRAVARKEGWETETLMAPFLGNIGWMESPGVRLRLHEDEERTRSCVVQVVCAGEPSMRKSSLKDFAAKTLLSHADVPEILRTGAAWSSDGTIKGIRGSIQVQNRAGLVSDEIADVCAVGPSACGRRHKTGLLYGNKEKLRTWLNCEDDRSRTREGRCTLSGYSFLHQVYGEVSLCERVLKPNGSMFAEGIHAAWQMRPVPPNLDQQTEHSKQFLIDFFGWLGRHASSDVRDHHFDGFAYTLFRNVQRAIEDFIQTVGRMPAASQHKLRYHDTDICRYANAIMRCCQYLRSTHSHRHEQQPSPVGVEMDVFCLAHALHIWRRQMHLWMAFYNPAKVAVLVGENAPPVPVPTETFAGNEKLQIAILTNDRCRDPISVSRVRELLKYFFQNEGVADSAAVVRQVVDDLLQVGLLQRTQKRAAHGSPSREDSCDGGREQAPEPAPGRACVVRRTAWGQIQDSPQCMARLARLQLTAAHFA